jgi:hypothetical protein
VKKLAGFVGITLVTIATAFVVAGCTAQPSADDSSRGAGNASSPATTAPPSKQAEKEPQKSAATAADTDASIDAETAGKPSIEGTKAQTPANAKPSSGDSGSPSTGPSLASSRPERSAKPNILQTSAADPDTKANSPETLRPVSKTAPAAGNAGTTGAAIAAESPKSGASKSEASKKTAGGEVVAAEGVDPVSGKSGAPGKTPAAATTKPIDRDALRAKIGKKHGGLPFDPVKEHGEYFKGWPVPKLALVITGREDGYMEPCGCAGLDYMKGGLSRRMSFLNEMRRAWKWPVLAVDVGGLNKGFGKQAELKFQNTVDAMRKMGYDAIAMGKGELRLPTAELVAHMSSIEKKDAGVFLSANVALFGFAEELTPTRKVCRVGDMRVGIAAVLGDGFRRQINNPELEMVDAETGIRKELAALQQAKCDLLVLLAHASIEESIALAKKFPEFQVVATAGGPPEPPHDKPQAVGKTMLVEVGEKGMAAIVLGFYDDPQQPVRYQRVLFDSRYKSAPEVVQIMALYQERLKDLGLESLGVQARPLPRVELQGTFVGSASCDSCHEESYRVWKKTGHSKAFRTLEEAKPPRQYDPECISCHVVGWEPQEFFPYKGGFLSKEKTPKLIDVGCESCHGPGGGHVAAEAKNDPELQRKMQKAVVVTKAEAKQRLCNTCHDLENSPDFNFDLYWPVIEHIEKKEKE